MPALELMMRILAQGDSSRLHRALVEQDKVAIAVDNYWQEGFDPGLTWFFLTLPADGDVAIAEAAFTREVAKVAESGVTAAELAKAKSLVIADFWRSLATINGKAQALGTYAVFHGDQRKLFEVPATFEKVTAEQIKALAARLLQVNNRTVGVLMPAAGCRRGPMKRALSRWLMGCALAGVTMSSVQAQESAVVGVRIPAYERVVLGNGATLLLMERHDVPLVGFQATLRGGALGEAQGKWGTASLLAGLLEKGAGKRDAYAFADASAAVGGTLAADAGLEALTVSGEFLARDQALMIELLADLLQRPRLDATEFEKLRERQIEFIRAAKDGDLSAVLPSYGAARTLQEPSLCASGFRQRDKPGRVDHADVTAYYRDQIGADRLILAVTGDFKSADMKKRLTDAFGGWARAKTPVPVAPPTAKVTGRQVLLVDAPGSAQTYFLMGNIGVSRKYPDRATLDVVNTLFGGRFTSMLNSELRIKSGLTYGARSQLVRTTQPGQWQIATYTRTDATVQAADLALEVYGKFKQGGAIDATALASGKSYVLGQFPTQLETSPQWARQLAELEFYGLDRKYVEGYGPALTAVTLADAARVSAEVYPSADDLAIVFIGDAAVIREGIKKYGPLTEMKLTDPTFAPQ